MSSLIDPTKPASASATTQSVRDNFSAAKTEIEALQALVAADITLGTPQASTSGTAIDFTGITTGRKRISVMFNGVSTNGTNTWLLQIGDSGGIEITTYVGGCTSSVLATSVASATSTAGFAIHVPTANTDVMSGVITLTLENASNNTWSVSGNLGRSAAAAGFASCGGFKATSAVVDRIRVTTAGGTSTFSAGEINIAYE